MNRAEIYIHPTCATSHEIIIDLYKKNYLDKVKIYNLLKPLESNFIWSVPWITINNNPVGTDPISSDEVIDMIENKKIEIEDALESFMMSILHSSYASSLVILHKSIEPVINESFVKASVRYNYSNIDINNLISIVKKNNIKLFEDYRDKIRRALSVSFVRELYWSKSGKINDEDIYKYSDQTIVGLWLLSKASIGRIGLPHKPYISEDEDVREIAYFINKRGHGLLEKIKEEQENIFNDRIYWDILKNL